MLLLYFLIFLGFNIFYTAFPVHATSALQWNLQQLGLFFSFMSALLILIQGPVLSRLSPILSDALLCIVGGFFLASAFLVLHYENNFVVYTSAALFALGNGLMWPSFLSLLSQIVEKRFQGYLQGVAASVGSVASIIGLIGGGIVYGQLGSDTFMVAAGVILLVALLSFPLLRLESATPKR